MADRSEDGEIEQSNLSLELIPLRGVLARSLIDQWLQNERLSCATLLVFKLNVFSIEILPFWILAIDGSSFATYVALHCVRGGSSCMWKWYVEITSGG